MEDLLDDRKFRALRQDWAFRFAGNVAGYIALGDDTDYTFWGCCAGIWKKQVVDPKTFEDYLRDGIARAQANDLQGAIFLFTQALDLYPAHPHRDIAHGCRGQAYLYVHAYDRSIADYTKAISLNPSD